MTITTPLGRTIEPVPAGAITDVELQQAIASIDALKVRLLAVLDNRNEQSK